MSTPVSKEEVIIWFNVHNLNYEKIELYGDFFKSLYLIISDTYLGDDKKETRIEMSDEDKSNHFDWCWKQLIEYQRKEKIFFSEEGSHKDYYKNFFIDTFYGGNQKNLKPAIPEFINDVFNIDKPFTKSDLDILTEIYSLMEKNLV
jgi:hypothetical protein